MQRTFLQKISAWAGRIGTVGDALFRQPVFLSETGSQSTGAPALELIFTSKPFEGPTMTSVNKVILIGNLGQDPTLRYPGSGSAVCNMRLATNESYTNKDGKRVDQTEWHTVVAWDRLAEICSEYLQTGSQVYFEGSLQTRTWEDRDGNKGQTTQVKAWKMVLLDPPAGQSGRSTKHGRSATQPRGRTEASNGMPSRPDREEMPFRGEA